MPKIVTGHWCVYPAEDIPICVLITADNKLLVHWCNAISCMHYKNKIVSAMYLVVVSNRYV